MRFADLCFATQDVIKLRTFYEIVFEQPAQGDDLHSWIHLPGLNIAFDDAINLKTLPAFSYIDEGPLACNVIVSFDVEDTDIEHERLLSLGIDTVLSKPTTHSWGARSFRFSDPDGHILNFRSQEK